MSGHPTGRLMRRQDATVLKGLRLGEFQRRTNRQAVAAVVGGEIGKGGDRLWLGEVAISDQEAADDVNVRMDEWRKAIKGVRRFKMIAIAGGGGGEQSVALVGLEGDWLGKGDIAEGTFEFCLGSLGYSDTGDLGGRRGVRRYETNGVCGFETATSAFGIR